MKGLFNISTLSHARTNWFLALGSSKEIEPEGREWFRIGAPGSCTQKFIEKKATEKNSKIPTKSKAKIECGWAHDTMANRHEEGVPDDIFRSHTAGREPAGYRNNFRSMKRMRWGTLSGDNAMSDTDLPEKDNSGNYRTGVRHLESRNLGTTNYALNLPIRFGMDYNLQIELSGDADLPTTEPKRQRNPQNKCREREC